MIYCALYQPVFKTFMEHRKKKLRQCDRLVWELRHMLHPWLSSLIIDNTYTGLAKLYLTLRMGIMYLHFYVRHGLRHSSYFFFGHFWPKKLEFYPKSDFFKAILAKIFKNKKLIKKVWKHSSIWLLRWFWQIFGDFCQKIFFPLVQKWIFCDFS